MEQALFEQNGGTYTKQGNYLLPDSNLPKQPQYEIGVWGSVAGSISRSITVCFTMIC